MRCFAVMAVLVLAGCAPEHIVQGRPYDVWTPPNFDPSTPLPVVILAHGYGASGREQDLVFPLSAQLKKRQFIYVLPNGTLDSRAQRFWNATPACCDFENRNIDDVGFFRALVDDVRAHYQVKAGHVFLVGHSNGAFMSLRLACEAGDVFSGVVAVAGSTFNDSARCGAGPAVPILLNHGDHDEVIFFNGKLNAYPSARETQRRLAAHNGCTGSPAEGGRLDLLGDATAETQQITVDGCPGKNDVDLWVLEGGPHIPQFDERWSTKALDWLEAHAP